MDLILTQFKGKGTFVPPDEFKRKVCFALQTSPMAVRAGVWWWAGVLLWEQPQRRWKVGGRHNDEIACFVKAIFADPTRLPHG